MLSFIGQTILIAQGADGEQQCVYVAEDGDALGLEDANNGVLSIDGNLVGKWIETEYMMKKNIICHIIQK